MGALCDHSIAHPAVPNYLVTHDGQLPPPGTQGAMSRFWRDVLADIEQAGAIRRAIADRDRVAEIGERNAVLVRERYRQSGYGDGLARLYAALVEP